MAVTILGSGTTPVVGARGVDSLSVTGGSGVSIITGDTDNYVMTSTGTGNELKGEPNLTFNGTTLVITGATTISGAATIGGALTADGIASAVTTSILHYNTGTGAVTYGASGGGTTNFLRADGTWNAPDAIDWDIFENGLSGDGSVAVLGGDLTETTAIEDDNGSYVLSLKTNNTGVTRSTTLAIGSGVLNIYSFENTGYSGFAYGHLATNGRTVTMASNATAGTKRSIILNSSSMTVTDDLGSTGLIYADDYSAVGVSLDRWLPDFAAVQAEIAGELGQLDDTRKIKRYTLTYDQDGDNLLKILSDLPTGTVILDIQIYVTTVFDDSGTNVITMGIAAERDRYIDSLDALTLKTGFAIIGPSIPDYLTSTDNVYVRYDGSNHDSTQGAAIVYVTYSDFA